jgi:hypothetical protein
MSDRFIDWLFDTLISVDVYHQKLLRGFGVLLLIPFALFLLSYVRVSFAFIKDRAQKGPLAIMLRSIARRKRSSATVRSLKIRSSRI